MAECKTCGYFVPNGAQKCAHCGEILNESLQKKARKWKWFALGTNLITVFASIATVIMAGALVYQGITLKTQTRSIKRQAESIEAQTQVIKKQFELEYIPVVKIGAISFNVVPYTETSGGNSVALYLTIPIENKHGFAYDIKIVKKVIALLRGTYGLEDSSLHSPLTQRSFELSNGQIKYDKIGIDETPINAEKYLNGTASFSIEYEITYTAMPEVTNDTFIYYFTIEFKKGRFKIINEQTDRRNDETSITR